MAVSNPAWRRDSGHDRVEAIALPTVGPYVIAMIRFLFRFAATAALAVAVIFGVIDSARSVSASTLVFTPLGQSWLDASPDTLAAVKEFAERHLWAPLWDPVMVKVLLAPGFAVFLALALFFHAIGYRPARRFGRLAVGD